MAYLLIGWSLVGGPYLLIGWSLLFSYLHDPAQDMAPKQIPTAQTVAEVRDRLLEMPSDDVVRMLAIMEQQAENGTATIENSPVHPLFVQAAGAMGRG